MKLNESQAKAVCHERGPALVMAGPGSGKTAVIIRRIQFLIDQLRIPAEDILAVTFSRKAAENMKDRFLAAHSGKGLPFFGTFHSIFFMILRFAYHLTTGNIIAESRRYTLIRELASSFHLEYEDEEEFANCLLNEISRIKNGAAVLENFNSSVVPARLFRQIFRLYSHALKNQGLIDFDDMLSLCLKLLLQREDIRSYWQHRFRYILVDEFQDINPIQYQILRLLARPQNNLFVVGDEDQSIYAFRGSSPEIMKTFLKDYPDAARITLTVSYRCAPLILNCAWNVISENKGCFDKQMSSHNPGKYGSVQIRKCKSQKEEYESIARTVEERLLKGIPAEKIAILARSSREFPFLMQELANRGIEAAATPCPPDIGEHFILRDLKAYIRLASECCSDERLREDFFRIINKPSRYISKGILQQAFLKLEADKTERICAADVLRTLKQLLLPDRRKLKAVCRLEYHLQLLKALAPCAKIQYICSAIGYEAYLKDYAAKTHGSYDNYRAILEALKSRAPSESGTALNGPACPEHKNPGGNSGAAHHAGHQIRLFTIHAAKGLEFREVYIPDVNEGFLPVKKAETPKALEEERRLLYVAMTRASETLRLYYAEEIHNKKTAPSRFLGCFLRKPL